MALTLLSDFVNKLYILEACSDKLQFAGQGGALLTKGTYCLADDFNRVILSMKRGQEYTDYINASFIDVSPVALAAPSEEDPSSQTLTNALSQSEARHACRNPNHFVRTTCLEIMNNELWK